MQRRSLSPSLSLVLALAVLGTAVPAPAEAQEDSLPSATYARKGLIIGGVAGGAAGAALLGLLAQGLCEYECEGAFLGGMLYGGVGGAILGGITGLVIGAAIPRGAAEARRGARPGPGAPPIREAEQARARDSVSGGQRSWAMRIGVGPTWPLHSESGGTAAWVSLAALRPISSRMDWGVEVGYMGRRTRVDVYTIPITQQDTAVITTNWEWTLWSASLMALGRVGPRDRPGGYLLATAGVYPYRESVRGTRTGDPPGHPGRPPIAEDSADPLPGVGLGAGGRWRLGDWVSLGVDSRLHLILGAGDELGVAVGSLGAALWLGR